MSVSTEIDAGHPLRVSITTSASRRFSTQLVAATPATAYVRVPDGQKWLMIETRSGVDHGLQLEWEFVDKQGTDGIVLSRT
jgi:hypothetical protein